MSNMPDMPMGQMEMELEMGDPADMGMCPCCGGQAHPGGVMNCPMADQVSYYPDGRIKQVVRNEGQIQGS